MQLHKNLAGVALSNSFIAAIGTVVIIIFWLSNSHPLFQLSMMMIPLVIPVLAVNLLASIYLWWKKKLIAARDYFLSWGIYSLVLGGLLTLAFHDMIVVVHSSNVVASAYVLVAALLFISMLRRLDKLRYDRERALAESKAKTDFLAKMSHEIRTPMNGVLGMSELLADTKLNDTQRYYTNVIYSSGHALLDVINEILDYSKIAAGKMALDCVNFDIRQLAQDSVSIFTAKAREKKIDLICRICPDTPTIWQGDEARIRQVLMNLLSNACKFTEAGEVVLNIEHQPEQGLCFSVRDTGIGIKDSEAENLFEDFSQADVSTSRKYGGTGLGLTICKQLVEMMGGSITFSSHYGLGSTFSFCLPLAIGDDNQPYQINTSHLQEKRILLADDNATFRQIVKEQFGTNGLTIIEASNGQQALDAIEEALAKGESFDLISLDIDMPIKDGIETAKAIQRNYSDKQLNIILLSSTSSLPSVEQYQQWGVSYAGQKPILAEQLAAVFSRMLGIHNDSKASDSVLAESPGDMLHILVAEDNDVNFQVVSAMLRKHGHIVQRAINGIHALEMFKGHNLNARSRPFDLILMDCEMPEMDGLSATAAIRELERIKALATVPIIALTAHAVEEQLNQCRQAGMNDVITKPFTSQKLHQCLASINQQTH
jgi:signal transduction histidine kinase/DNA-binding response OmpR family regulator